MTPAEAIALISDGAGFTFVQECDDQFRCEGVVFKRIAGEPVSLESGIVYRPDGCSPIVHALIAALQSRKSPQAFGGRPVPAVRTA